MIPAEYCLSRHSSPLRSWLVLCLVVLLHCIDSAVWLSLFPSIVVKFGCNMWEVCTKGQLLHIQPCALARSGISVFSSVVPVQCAMHHLKEVKFQGLHDCKQGLFLPGAIGPILRPSLQGLSLEPL